MGNWDQLGKQSGEEGKKYAEAAPEFMAAFGAMGEAAAKDRPFDDKTAEMLFVAIGIARQCERCIVGHTQLAYKVGVTREELVAVINISILMGGGPASAFGSMALQIYDEAVEASK